MTHADGPASEEAPAHPSFPTRARSLAWASIFVAVTWQASGWPGVAPSIVGGDGPPLLSAFALTPGLLALVCGAVALVTACVRRRGRLALLGISAGTVGAIVLGLELSELTISRLH
jgi:hypothetical protein